MRKMFACFPLVALCFIANASFGQTNKQINKPRLPIQANSNFFKSLSQSPNFIAQNRLSVSTNAATQSALSSAQPSIRSIPHFASSFTFQGQSFPYTMVGRAPQTGRTTRVDTSYVALSFVFDEFVDQNGNNITIDGNAITDEMLNSPNFRKSPYTVGNTQFGDAVQRAEFFNVMKRSGDDDADDQGWHTLLEAPRILTAVTIEVPFFESLVFQTPQGTILALIDINFIASQLNTLLQTEGVRVEELPIFVTRNAVYGDFFAGSALDCCIGGFHSAFETAQRGNTTFVQTFAFATALDADVSNFVFGDPTIFADVAAMSHEISEWMNDPFVNNVVPSWQFPNLAPGTCSNLLETGDPVENLPNPAFPVTLNGFTYHPQTEALLQWFSRQTPSDAFGGAFSYPGANLTTPSQACPVL